MIPFLKSFFFDSTVFVRIMRAMIGAAGIMVEQGKIPTGIDGGGAWVGPVLLFLALMVGSTQLQQAKKME